MAKSERRKRASADLPPEEQLRLAGYSVDTAHGVSKDHPDETTEGWADRVRGEHEAEIKEQQEQAEAQAEVVKSEEPVDGS